MKKPKKEEAMRWFTHAKDEFNDADELRKRQRFYLALFHFQQSSEKALKAYLYLKVKSIEIFYTHSINNLINMVVELDRDFKELISVKKLDHAETAMLLAKKVIDLVEKKINLE